MLALPAASVAGEILRVDPDERDAIAVLLARRFEFGVEAAVAAAGVEGLVEPVDEVARGLQRPIGDRLDGAEDGAELPGRD